MKWRNSEQAYGWVSIALHWLMAVFIIAMFALGVWMRTLGYYDVWYHRAPELHKSIGVLLLFLLIFRWLWRLLNTRPVLLGQRWERWAALTVHRLHYVLLSALMLTGYLIPTAEGVGIDVFGMFTVPAWFSLTRDTAEWVGMAHRYLAWSAVILAGLHAMAALKHHIVDQDMTLRRMLGLSPRNQNEKQGE